MSLRTLYDEASLWMTPGGYEDGKLFSELPTDGSGDFTFTRGSNLSATRVGPNGYIEKGYENLLLQSNTFSDAAWSVSSGATIIDGQAGYDGTNDAWLLSKTDSSKYLSQSAIINGLHTFSFYAKAGDSNFIWIKFYNVGEAVTFDLQNGITLGLTNAIDAKIELVSGTTDWYRCSITANFNSTFFRIFPAEGNAVISGTSGSIYIQDAQLEAGLVATDYIETGASTAQAGILEDMPRIDFSDGCGHLLLEPSRTNLFAGSEYLTGWNLSIGVTPEYNYGISPEGVKNSVKLQSTTSAFNRIEEVLTLSAGVDYTFSLYIKNIDSTQSAVMGTSDLVLYDINWNGAEISSVTTGLNYKSVGNGWYRIWETSQSDTSSVYRIYPDKIGGSGAIEIYGLQLEQDATYPTSYIPTYGVSQTRLRDSAAELSNDIISGATEFTWLFDNTGTELDGQINVVFQLVCTGTALRYYSSQGGRFYAGGYFGEADAIGKLCVKYDGTTITMFKDGIKSTSTSSTNLGTTVYLDELFTSNNLGTPIKLNQMLFFKTALSDTECIELTINGLKEDLITAYKTRATTLEAGAEDRLDTYLQQLEDFIIV